MGKELKASEYLKKIQDLQEQLSEKDTLLKTYEENYSKLVEDFNYNVNLIYDRDKEIEYLSQKIDELLSVNREKDIQLVSLQSLYVRVKQLEADKAILSGRVESLLSQNVHHDKRGSSTPNPSQTYSHKYRVSTALPKESVNTPLNKLNFDLEKRIQALETETHLKIQDCQTAQNKDQHIAEMIKSLSPNKVPKRSLQSFDADMNTFLKDIKKIKEGVSRDLYDGNCEMKHVPIIRS